jgi:hypothetical protein
MRLSVNHFDPSLKFAGKAGAYQIEPVMELLVLPTNIRLGLKWLTSTNTLAYYCTGLATVSKIFIIKVL